MDRRIHNQPELLAPVQDWKTLKEIVDIADAVYFGIQEYNMRQKAKNFNRSELKDIIDFCHNSDPPIKAYLATNILIYDSELQDLEQLISEAESAQIDAIIAHDIATIRFARRNGVNFHISTQAILQNVLQYYPHMHEY